MEDELVKLNNKLSHKIVQIYEVSGIPNNNGEIIERFSETQKFNNSYDFYVSMIELQAASMFPNIIKEKNNIFTYSVGVAQNELASANNIRRVIEFETGAYEVEDINKHIQDNIGNDHITIELDKGTGKSKIKLKNGYKIHFTSNKDIRQILGYSHESGNIILEQELNTSPKMCNVMDTNKIYMHLDIIRGMWYKGKPSQILYSFSNDVAFGMPISIKPKNLQEYLLVTHQFNELRIKFTNEKNEAINFMSTPVTVTIQVRQV
jgi:hypothetical protein